MTVSPVPPLPATQRRQFITSLAALVGGEAVPAWAEGLQAIAAPQRFDYAALKGQALSLSRKPYAPPSTQLPRALEALDWDAYQSIRFRPDHALWHDDKLRFQAQFFHLGLYFRSPVRLYELADGVAQELAYVPEMFDHGQSGLDPATLPRGLGFAGFRLNFHTDLQRDITAFLGASYFRAVGGELQYGLSARGLAIGTGAPVPEEFPNFTGFWLERPAVGSNSVTVYALLDSPSVAGAYRFVITPGDTQVMDIDAALYPRTSIERLGLAPCTSMFQTGENDRRMGYDWRGEIHDSDGLAMWTGNGEWIWRPLTNPRQLTFNAFQDHHPRGFGLLQRDRAFDHYQDDGVFYEKRPSLWVQPKSGWGAGSVQLVEIPTVDETFDNIVAFWNPARPIVAGEELLLGYRLYWGGQPPAQSPLARCVATRTGLGGVIGKKRTVFSWRFAVDFAGGDLALLSANAMVTAVITASAGARIETTSARPLHAVRGYRALFDVVPTASTEPIELRLYLSCAGQSLSETWLYQWVPPPMAERTLY